jgi:glycosyltransferase 2 family protein
MMSRLMQLFLGLACATLFLWLALAQTNIAEMKQALISADLIWMALGILSYASNLLIRSVRWQLILRQVSKIGFAPVLTALLIGYGVNSIFPARLGELFRAEYCKQRYGLPRVWALASIGIERLLDGIMVILCLGIGLLISQGSGQIARVLGGALAMAAAIFGSIFFTALLLSGESLTNWFERWPRVREQLDMVKSGLRVVRSRRFPVLLAISLVVYVPDTLSIWLAVKSVGVTLSFGDALVLTGAAALATLLPSGPAFLGTLQLAYALTMEFVAEPVALGIAAAVLVQACYFLPVAIIAGLLIAYGSGRTLTTILKFRHAG